MAAAGFHELRDVEASVPAGPSSDTSDSAADVDGCGGHRRARPVGVKRLAREVREAFIIVGSVSGTTFQVVDSNDDDRGTPA